MFHHCTTFLLAFFAVVKGTENAESAPGSLDGSTYAVAVASGSEHTDFRLLEWVAHERTLPFSITPLMFEERRKKRSRTRRLVENQKLSNESTKSYKKPKNPEHKDKYKKNIKLVDSEEMSEEQRFRKPKNPEHLKERKRNFQKLMNSEQMSENQKRYKKSKKNSKNKKNRKLMNSDEMSVYQKRYKKPKNPDHLNDKKKKFKNTDSLINVNLKNFKTPKNLENLNLEKLNLKSYVETQNPEHLLPQNTESRNM